MALLLQPKDDSPALALSWSQLCDAVQQLSTRVAQDGPPDVVVGVLRGGMIPAVLIAHALGSRSVRAVEVTHTAADGVNAVKTVKPHVRDPRTVGDLTGLDVLVVDDIAGTGDTIAVTRAVLRRAGAARVRTLACVVNKRNWYAARTDKPDEALTYIGMTVEGWVIFPWETQ